MNRERKRTCDLEAFKAAFSDPGRLAITGTALKSAAAMGFGRPEIVETIQTMRREHLYKSMPAYSNSRLWQDGTMSPLQLACST